MLDKLKCLLWLHAWVTKDSRMVRFKNRKNEVISSGIAILQKCENCNKKRAWFEDSFGKITILSVAVHENEIANADARKKRKWSSC